MGPRFIDLNADLGEGCPWDHSLLERVTSASISCAAHAGDEGSVRAALAEAASRGVVVGAHPGYADREHFGRRDVDLPPDLIRQLVLDQVRFLSRLATAHGASLRYVKPHGALYNQAQRDPVVALAVLEAARELDLPLVGMPRSAVAEEAARLGVRLIREGFVDRRYGSDGRLVSRSEPNAQLNEPAEVETQTLQLLDQGVETLCIHGDRPDALDLADALRALLGRFQVAIRPVLKP